MGGARRAGSARANPLPPPLLCSYTNALLLLTAVMLPACAIPLFTVPAVVGASPGGAAWRPAALLHFSRPMYAISGLQLLQNAGQYLWLQVPIAHLLRSKDAPFALSHVGVSGLLSAVMIYEGLQQSATLPLLKVFGQAPPRTNNLVGEERGRGGEGEHARARARAHLPLLPLFSRSWPCGASWPPSAPPR